MLDGSKEKHSLLYPDCSFALFLIKPFAGFTDNIHREISHVLGDNTMDDQTAIACLQQGDISGLEALVHRHQTQALRAAHLITRDRAMAEDIVQAAFLRIYERIDQFDNTRPFGPWFLRIVINDAMKAVAFRKRHVSLNEPLDQASYDQSSLATAVEGDPYEVLAHVETQQAVRQALNQLSPLQRAVVVQRYYLEMSEAEQVDELGCAAGTIKWRLYAARERLRSLLRPFWTAESPRECDK